MRVLYTHPCSGRPALFVGRSAGHHTVWASRRRREPRQDDRRHFEACSTGHRYDNVDGWRWSRFVFWAYPQSVTCRDGGNGGRD